MKKQDSVNAENSYEKGIPIAFSLFVFFLLPFILSLAGLIKDVPLIVCAIPGIIAFAVFLISVIIAKARKDNITEFLSSNRVILEWTYSFEESGRIRKEIYEDSKEDFRFIFIGCTLIFGLIGLLTGIMPGMNFPLFFGGWLVFGICLGLIIGYGTMVQNERGYKSKKPIYFAIGESEIFYRDDYFKADNSRPIRELSFDEKTNTLTIITAGTKSFSKKEWIIRVPKEQVEKLLQIIHKIKIIKEENYDIDEEESEETD